MTMRARLRRVREKLGPPPEPAPELSHEERLQGTVWWLDGQTYNRGIFDADPEFRPAWSRYHDLWSAYIHGRSPLAAVWVRWRQPDLEEARRRVVEIMVGVLRLHPSPVRVQAKVLGRSIQVGEPT